MDDSQCEPSEACGVGDRLLRLSEVVAYQLHHLSRRLLLQQLASVCLIFEDASYERRTSFSGFRYDFIKTDRMHIPVPVLVFGRFSVGSVLLITFIW